MTKKDVLAALLSSAWLILWYIWINSFFNYKYNQAVQESIIIDNEIDDVQKQIVAQEKQISFMEEYRLPYLESDIAEIFIMIEMWGHFEWLKHIRTHWEKEIVSNKYENIDLTFFDWRIYFSENLKPVEQIRWQVITLLDINNDPSHKWLFYSIEYDILKRIVNEVIDTIWVDNINSFNYSPWWWYFNIVLNNWSSFYFNKDSYNRMIIHYDTFFENFFMNWVSNIFFRKEWNHILYEYDI